MTTFRPVRSRSAAEFPALCATAIRAGGESQNDPFGTWCPCWSCRDGPFGLSWTRRHSACSRVTVGRYSATARRYAATPEEARTPTSTDSRSCSPRRPQRARTSSCPGSREWPSALFAPSPRTRLTRASRTTGAGISRGRSPGASPCRTGLAAHPRQSAALVGVSRLHHRPVRPATRRRSHRPGRWRTTSLRSPHLPQRWRWRSPTSRSRTGVRAQRHLRVCFFGAG